MDDTILPGSFDFSSLSNDDLLDTFVLSGNWINCSCSKKQERAWAKLEKKCRAEIINRMMPLPIKLFTAGDVGIAPEASLYTAEIDSHDHFGNIQVHGETAETATELRDRILDALNPK